MPSRFRAFLDDLRRHDSVLWRRAIDAGVAHGPDAFVRYSPPVFGLAFCAALPGKRRIVRDNLRRTRGRRGPLRDALDVARVFTNFASSLTESFVAAADGGASLTARCDGDQHFLDAARDGKGVVVVTAHTGGWQAAGAILRRVHAAEVLIVMRPERDGRAQALSDSTRDRSGIRLAHVGDHPTDALVLLRHLRSGGVVALQIDRLPAGLRGRNVSLFGEPHRMPEGPLTLASVSGAPIVPVFTRRLGFMDYGVTVAPPIRLPRRPSTAELDGAARTVAARMEEFVARNPLQWFHFE